MKKVITRSALEIREMTQDQAKNRRKKKKEIEGHNQRNSKKRVKSYVRERKHYKKVRGKRWRKHLSLPHKLLLHLLVLFWSNDSTPDDNSAPGVVLVSLSSVELDDSDSVSDNFVFFFFAGLECTLSFLGATFFGEGDLCFNETWPCMYGRRDVIRLLVKAISFLNDS